MCISPCRLMNIYLHKACTKLLQLTVIGWTITVKDGWGGSIFFFFLFFEAIFFCFVFTFDLHMYCDDMLINWNRLVLFCFFLLSL